MNNQKFYYEQINKWIKQKTSNRLLREYLLKLILVGLTQSGKSSILGRFIGNGFKEDTPATIAIDFRMKTIILNGNSVKLQIVKLN